MVPTALLLSFRSMGMLCPALSHGCRADETDTSYTRPFPYHPIGSSKTHGQVADEEGVRLQNLFEGVAEGLAKA